MRKYAFIMLVLPLAAVGLWVLFVSGDTVRAMPLTISVRDMRDRGVVLTSAIDTAGTPVDQSGKESEAMANGSCPVVLSNRGQQAIVGYVLNWEFTNRAGQTRVVSRAFSSITQAMASRHSVRGAYIVPPGESRLMDLLGEPVQVKNSASVDEIQSGLSPAAVSPEERHSSSS